MAVLDPLRTKIAEQADLHLAIKPGTDVALGFALAVELERLGAHDRAFVAEHGTATTNAWRWHGRGRRKSRRTRAGYAGRIRKLGPWMAEADPLAIAPGNRT